MTSSNERPRIASALRLGMGAWLCMLLAACGSDNGGHKSPSPTASIEDTKAAVRQPRLGAAGLQKLREQWGVAILEVLSTGDSLHGQIASLLANPTFNNRNYFIMPDALNADDPANALPKQWTETHDTIRGLAQSVSTARSDLKKWADGADVDDDFKAMLKRDSENIIADTCSTLASAREYYTSSGGYANDISFALISEKGDRPCTNVLMTRPYSTSMKRRGVVTIAWSTSGLPDSTNETAFIDDHTGFIIQARQTVTVQAHRVSDGEEMNLCQIHGGGGTGWVPCSWLSRQPTANDG